MTVASLWKALDRCGCGKRIGAKELQDHHRLKSKINPWSVCEMTKLSRSPENRPVLAVDLSIWICEALTSSAMKDNHVADPPLHLVYSRVLKLLNLGMKLVIVVEGKRRDRARNTASNAIRSDHYNGKNDSDAGVSKMIGDDKFRKRRSGTLFWTACQRCEIMLKLLGVIVVRAKAEGEALCALLNQKGIVDGVISNDGDCLLFGAKVLYTKFSVENLDHSNVIRYDADDIRAVVDDDDADRYDETGLKSKHGQNVVEMSRNDLIAFAILTGSDLVGEGLSKVGCRKAIRFIRKCQIDNPLKFDGDSSPAIDQLLSWEQTAPSSFNDKPQKDTSGPHCSCCGHLGTKKDHKKYGCEGCGTKPGEHCFKLSPGGRFRKLIRSKALAMQSCFDPSLILKAYNEPNENQVPFCLVGKTARTLKMISPQPEKFLESPFIIRGRSLSESREYVRKTLSAYLARQELFDQMYKSAKGDQRTKLPKNHNRPAPIRVNKLLLRNGNPSCEVKWIIKATTSDAEGNPMDQYEFSTVEDKFVIKKCYPKLLHIFQEEQKKIQQQGTAEQEKRRTFLLSMEKSRDQGVEIPVDETKKSQTRKDYFGQVECIHKSPTNPKGVSDDVRAILTQVTKKKDNKKRKMEKTNTDLHIGRFISTKTDVFREMRPKQHVYQNDDEKALIGDVWGREEMNDDSSTINTINHSGCVVDEKNMSSPNSQKDYFHDALTPGHKHYLGIESVFEFRCMAKGDCHLNMAHATSSAVKDQPVVPDKFQSANQENARLATRKAQIGEMNLESISRKVSSIIGYNANEAFLSEYERSVYLPEAVAVFPFVEEEPNLPTAIGQINLSNCPLAKRRKYEAFEKHSCKINDCYHDDRAVFVEDDSRTNFLMWNHKSLEQIYEVEQATNNVNSVMLCQRNQANPNNKKFGFHPFNSFHDQINEKIELYHERDSVKLDLESSRRFDCDQSQIGDYHLKGKFYGKRLDLTRSDFHAFDHEESYDKHEHIRSTKQRTISLHQQAEIYVKQDQSDFNIENNYCDKCYRLHERQYEDICSNNNDDDVHEKIRISRNLILEDQNKMRERDQRGPKKQKQIHHFGSPPIPNQGEDVLYCCEECNLHGKKDSLYHDDCFVARPASFDMLRPLDPAYKFEDRNYSQDSYYSPLFDERNDREDELCYTETLNRELIGGREIEQGVACGSAWRLGASDDHQDQSNCMDTLDPKIETQVIGRDELENRVAMKVESRNRRAQIGLLCSKYIREECWDSSLM